MVDMVAEELVVVLLGGIGGATKRQKGAIAPLIFF
jgi:hypothetical protein